MNQEQKEHSKEAATPIEEDKVEDTIDQQNDPLSAAVSQLQQLTAAETQALIQATAQAMGANDHQQFFSTLDSTNVVLAASIVAAAAASANSATNTNEAERKETTAARTTSTSSGSISNSHSNKRKREIVDFESVTCRLVKTEIDESKEQITERKKRWRQQNEERNKDNDLRCRVNKRAHKLFGKEDNEHKRAWIEEEFRKRQQKRKEKERRKGMIDNSLGAAAHVQPNDLNTLTQHFLSPQQHGQQQQLPDINYLTMLCNSLGIAGAARALIGNAAAAFNHTSTPTAAASSSSSETNNVAIESKPDAKTEENPRPEIKNEANVNTDDSILSATSEENMATQGSPSPSSSTAAAVTDNNEVENKDQNKSAASLQLLEFLHHLQQYQPQQQHIIENNNSSTSSELAALPTFPGLEVTRPEEKLAALLATTLHAAAAAATTKEEGPERTASTSSTAPAAEHTEFPLDAVLTLMQLNAGWRQ